MLKTENIVWLVKPLRSPPRIAVAMIVPIRRSQVRSTLTYKRVVTPEIIQASANGQSTVRNQMGPVESSPCLLRPTATNNAITRRSAIGAQRVGCFSAMTRRLTTHSICVGITAYSE